MKTTNVIICGFVTGSVLSAFSPKKTVITPIPQEPVLLRVETPDKWDLFIEALAWVESRHGSLAVGRTNDAGYLQITPVIIAEANRILGYKVYTLEDRVSKVKSLEIFKIIQDHYNPEHDMPFALKLWNPKAPVSYHRQVMAEFNQLINKQRNDILLHRLRDIQLSRLKEPRSL